MNKVVARYADGRLVRGLTNDFDPAKEQFHISVADAPPGAKSAEVQTQELKALFFVRDYAGNPQHQERKEFDSSKPSIGRKIRVLFKDGEMLVGYTQGYQRGRPGFFLIPVDSDSNTERCYVVSSATREIAFV